VAIGIIFGTLSFAVTQADDAHHNSTYNRRHRRRHRHQQQQQPPPPPGVNGASPTVDHTRDDGPESRPAATASQVASVDIEQINI